MNNKYLVIISVPILEEEFDIYIPINKKVGTVKKLILEMIDSLSDHTFFDDGTKNLYDKNTGEKISEEDYVKDSKIKNGSKLILY